MILSVTIDIVTMLTCAAAILMIFFGYSKRSDYALLVAALYTWLLYMLP